MACGKPVITTDWSGNTDFADISNSFPVAYELTTVASNVGPYKAGETWAEPDVEHAAWLMRQVVNDSNLATRRGHAARQRIQRDFSEEAVGTLVGQRLDAIRSRDRLGVLRCTMSAFADGYRDLVGAIRTIASTVVPPGEVIAVVSRGDPELLKIERAQAWHFPEARPGVYAGCHPADSNAAVAELEGARARGAAFLLFPGTSSGGWNTTTDFGGISTSNTTASSTSRGARSLTCANEGGGAREKPRRGQQRHRQQAAQRRKRTDGVELAAGTRPARARRVFRRADRSEHCVDAQGAAAPSSAASIARTSKDVLRTHGFSRRAALICDAGDTLDGAVVHGATASELHDLADAADLLINISGHLSVRALKTRFRRRAYVDLDPGYTQMWHDEQPDAARLDGHHVFFTVGQRVGTDGCRIPTNGISWCRCDNQSCSRNFARMRQCPADSPRSPVGAVPTRQSRAMGRPSRQRRTSSASSWSCPRISGQVFEIALDIHRVKPVIFARFRIPDGGLWTHDSSRLRLKTIAVISRVRPPSVRRLRGCTYRPEAVGSAIDPRNIWRPAKPVLVQDTGFGAPAQGEGTGGIRHGRTGS
jgi:hypothetical protein